MSGRLRGYFTRTNGRVPSTISEPLASAAPYEAHPYLRHNDPRNGPAVLTHNVNERTFSRREKGAAHRFALQEFRATGLLHQAPVLPRADRDVPAAVSDRRAISPAFAEFARMGTVKRSQPLAIGLILEFQALPERLYRSVESSVQLERRRRQIADRLGEGIRTRADDIERFAARFEPMPHVMKLQRADAGPVNPNIQHMIFVRRFPRGARARPRPICEISTTNLCFSIAFIFFISRIPPPDASG